MLDLFEWMHPPKHHDLKPYAATRIYGARSPYAMFYYRQRTHYYKATVSVAEEAFKAFRVSDELDTRLSQLLTEASRW